MKKISSQAYTPGLKRRKLCIVEKSRILPISGEVLVNEGDNVYPDTLVARTNVPGEPRIVKVALALGVDTDVDQIENYMLKKSGESITKNEPIAQFRALWGLINKICYSPVSGTVESISNLSGYVIVREDPISVELNAYITGIIEKILPNEGVIVRTPASLIQGIFGIGGETHGELMIMSKSPEDILEAEQVTSECAGKILIAGAIVTAEALRKAVDVGAKGIIVGGIESKDLKDFLGYDIGVAITGHEEVGITLILTEGFGKMKMLEKTFELLKEFEGKLACINGTTQIRAGVMRPEVIIPRGDVNISQIPKHYNEETLTSEGLKPGTIIRLIRKPYFGALGKVISLPVELQQLETESKVRVLEVELEDGRRIIVKARANVEIIEE